MGSIKGAIQIASLGIRVGTEQELTTWEKPLWSLRVKEGDNSQWHVFDGNGGWTTANGNFTTEFYLSGTLRLKHSESLCVAS
jgi:hypothetical protein